MVVLVLWLVEVLATTLVVMAQSLVKDDSDSGADEVDLSNWDWKDLSSASTSSSSTASQTQTSSSALKPDELKKWQLQISRGDMEVFKWTDYRNYFGWTVESLGIYLPYRQSLTKSVCVWHL